MTKTKIERRYIAVQRILRKRNYGLIKAINSYTAQIYSATYRKGEIDELGRTMYKQLTESRTESMDEVYDKLNVRIDKLFEDIKRFITLFLMQGSRKVFDNKGAVLSLKTPNYTKVIERLTEQNMRYVRNITDDQRKILLDEVTKGIKAGKPYSAMAEGIQSRIGSMSKARATLIAQNEGQSAHAYAQERTMKENGVEKYQWLTAGDDRVSAICKSLHRKVFKFGEVGKMNWTDANGKELQIDKSPRPVKSSHIRCRCCCIAIFDD